MVFLKKFVLKHMNLVCLFWAFMASFGISAMVKGAKVYHTLSNSIFSLLLIPTLYFFYKRYLESEKQEKDVRLNVICIMLGGALAFSMVIGSNLLSTGFSWIGYIRTWFGIITATFFTTACIKYLFLELPIWYEETSKSVIDSSKNMFFINWLLIFIGWLPGLIASYPGVFGYDSVYQVDFYANDWLLLHHPIMHTLLLGFCVVTLGDYFGDPAKGILVYSLFQMLILSGAFSYMLSFLRKERIPKLLYGAIFVLVVFLPTNAIMSFSSTKDIIYSAMFLLMMTLIVELCIDESKFYDIKHIILLFFASFTNAIFRSQGIYIIIVGIFVGIILFKGKSRLRWILGSALLLAALMLYNGPITRLMGGVPNDSIHEMMSVPVMQLGRSATLNGEKLTDEEFAEIEEYIPDYRVYPDNQEGISDLLKNTFNSELFKSDPARFFKLWFEVGKKCPGSYFDAFARLSIGLWYPDMNYRDPKAFHPYWEYENMGHFDPSWVYIERKTPKCLQWLSDLYWHLTYSNLNQYIPGFSMLFSSGAAAWFILLASGYLIYIKRYIYLLPMFILIAAWGTLLLGPVVLYRYVYPLFVSVPVIVGLIWHVIAEQNKK